MTDTDQAQGRSKLRKELTIWGAIGISLALMGPSMAANIDPQGTATDAGRAVPLAFFIAMCGVLLVAYGFVRLTQQFNHAGSVYGFVGAVVGPRAGVMAGWSLMGTYAFYTAVCALSAGIFGASFLDAVGIWHSVPNWGVYMISAIALIPAWALAVVPVRRAVQVFIALEASTVVLILIIAFVVLIRLLTHTAHGHTFTLSVFSISKGTSVSGLFLGVVFGFLAFAGFEAAATLGEETKHPRRDIPRAILGVAIFGGVFFVFATAIEMMAFGANAKGVAAYIASGSLMGDLGRQYIAGWVGDVVILGTVFSAFASGLACIVGSSRIMFALTRDGVGPKGLSKVSSTQGTPMRATALVVTSAWVMMAFCILVSHAKPFDEWIWFSTIGTLILLFVYMVNTIGAIKLLFFSGLKKVARWEIVIPLAGIIVLGYTLYRNVVPYPKGAGAWLPPICVVWVLGIVVYVFLRPAVAHRAGVLLTEEEGLTAAAGREALAEDIVGEAEPKTV